MDKKIILVVDSNRQWRNLVRTTLERTEGFSSRYTISSYALAKPAAEKILRVGPENVALLITDGLLYGQETAITVYDFAASAGYRGKCIVFSGDIPIVRKIAEKDGRSLADMFFRQVEKRSGQKQKDLISAVKEALK